MLQLSPLLNAAAVDSCKLGELTLYTRSCTMDEQKMALSAASSRVLRDSIVDGVLMSL
jgi:hypothetical protein